MTNTGMSPAAVVRAADAMFQPLILNPSGFLAVVGIEGAAAEAATLAGTDLAECIVLMKTKHRIGNKPAHFLPNRIMEPAS